MTGYPVTTYLQIRFTVWKIVRSAPKMDATGKETFMVYLPDLMSVLPKYSYCIVLSSARNMA